MSELMSHIVQPLGNRNPSLFDTIEADGAAVDLIGLGADVNLKARFLLGATTEIDADAVVANGATTLVGAHQLPVDVLVLTNTTGFLPAGVVSAGGQLVRYAAINGNTLIGCTGGSGTIANGAAVTQRGGVRYDWAAADVDTAGFLSAKWVVTVSGKTQDTPTFVIEIRPDGHFANALCTLEHIREDRQSEADDREKDTLAQIYILRATDLILLECRREFAPKTDNATRRFRVHPRRRLRGAWLVDLSPFDLRVATEIKLHPETSAPTTLASTDYLLEHEDREVAVFKSVLLPSRLDISSDVHADFGFAQLDIRGNWGFPSVPKSIEQACVKTVKEWMRGGVDSASSFIELEGGQVAIPDALPRDVVRILSHWKRQGFA